MDIQFAIDPYAVLTYMVSYVGKDETGMTEFLKEVLKKHEDADLEEKLRFLKIAYLTHRQIGQPEAIYRLFPHMRLTDSSITTIFVQSSTPEQRQHFFRKIVDKNTEDFTDDLKVTEENDDNDDNENHQDSQNKHSSKGVKIEGKEGSFQQTLSISDKYAGRPEFLEQITLAQFATSYEPCSKVRKNVRWNSELNISDEFSVDMKIIGLEDEEDIYLPKYINLKDSMGYMRLRGKRIVLRFHSSKKKETHEGFYSEMFLFSHWRMEVTELHPDDPEECQKAYEVRFEEIKRVREDFFHGEEVLNLLEFGDISDKVPQHIIDELDNQGAQDQADAEEEGLVDDPDFVTFQWQGDDDEQPKSKRKENLDCAKFKRITLPSNEHLIAMTRQLVTEQKIILRDVIKYCKSVRRARDSQHVKISPIRMIIHGGAGTGKTFLNKVLAYHAEKILRQPGDHPDKPRVLLCAPTGKAASLIGGITLHKAFSLQFDNKHHGLSDKQLAEFRSHFEELRLIIIDEMSLMDADKLYQILMRLREVLQNEGLFGNIAIILVGDILQVSQNQSSEIIMILIFHHYICSYDQSTDHTSFKGLTILTSNHSMM